MSDSGDDAAKLPRNVWRDAVWDSTLPYREKLAALCYADHAKPHGRNVWVTTARGTQRTSMPERSWKRAVSELRAAGWLQLVKAGRAGRDGGRAAEYVLTIPEGMSARGARILEKEGQTDRNECQGGTPTPAVPPAVSKTASRSQTERSRADDDSTSSSYDADAYSGRHMIPSDYWPTSAMLSWARRELRFTGSLRNETEAFVDQHLGGGDEQGDWNAAWFDYVHMRAYDLGCISDDEYDERLANRRRSAA